MGRISKDKRDIYYRKAKEDGYAHILIFFFCSRYRARSAYKLLQLNDQFNLLNESVQRAVDLCAAPGSWSQVLASRLNRDEGNARIVAVDLQEMSPIEGVITLQGDITSYDTVKSVIDACGGELADLVICDGAPDVTGLHDLDEYVQFKLLLSALNISTLLLRSGGNFVAKVFRGENIDLLVAKLRIFFREGVWVSKPKSSRNSSIECFIVGKGFCMPEGYTPELSPDFCLLEKREDSSHRKQEGIVQFLSCGDLSAWDADRNYTLEPDSEYIPPIQPPTNPAYREAMEEVGRGNWHPKK
jgi:tRNA (cytidine32/guanosine34-2'-O)-methyltransferase